MVGNVVLVDFALRIVHRVIAHGVDSVMLTLSFIGKVFVICKILKELSIIDLFVRLKHLLDCFDSLDPYH